MQLTYAQAYWRTTFLTRLSEWQSGVILFMWGLILVLPATNFGTPAYGPFNRIFSAYQFGSFLMAGGAGRLIVLSLNGIWRPMYWVRMAASISTMMVWLILAMGFVLSLTFGAWIAIIPPLIVFEAANAFRAAIDAAQAQLRAA